MNSSFKNLLERRQGMSKLRQDFINYMTLRRFSENTVRAYVQAVRGLAVFYQRPPDQLTPEQVQAYLLHLLNERKLAWSSCNIAAAALCSFYTNVLHRQHTEFDIPSRPRQRRLPSVHSEEEVWRLLNSVANLKHRALLMTIYGGGLRVSEAVHLKPHHVESQRMLIRIEQGKGGKDRSTILPQRLLDELRQYWRVYRPDPWLFSGQNPEKPMTRSSAHRIYHQAKKAAGITTGRGIHTLRHCFATHLLDQGTDIYTIKEMLGHSSVKTTTKYIHISQQRIASVKSPLDTLPPLKPSSQS